MTERRHIVGRRANGSVGRVVIIAHYAEGPSPSPRFMRFVAGLATVCDRCFVVSTSPLRNDAAERLGLPRDQVITRPNVGFDFASWRDALARGVAHDADELVLTNSSLIGPVRPLAEIFAEIEQRPCDFWGLTEGRSPRPHLQSYFLVFRRRALEHPAFAAFFAGVRDLTDKAEVVREYELTLTERLSAAGLRSDVLLRYHDVLRYVWGPLAGFRNGANLTYHFPLALIDLGFPFMKVEALRGVRWSARAGLVRRVAEAARRRIYLDALARRGVPVDDLDVPPEPRGPTLGSE